MSWESVRAHLADNWKVGEHASILAPTGYGKSHLARELLGLWAYTLTLDIKGDGDEVVSGMGRKVDSYPDPWALRRDKDHHYIISPGWPGGPVHGQALAKAWGAGKAKGSAGSWLVYVDETLVAVKDLGLGDALRSFWVAGRSRGLTLVASNQSARDIPREFYDQPRWHFFGNLRDDRVLFRVEEVGAGDKAMMRATIPDLDDDGHEWLVVGPRKYAARFVVGK